MASSSAAPVTTRHRCRAIARINHRLARAPRWSQTQRRVPITTQEPVHAARSAIAGGGQRDLSARLLRTRPSAAGVRTINSAASMTAPNRRARGAASLRRQSATALRSKPVTGSLAGAIMRPAAADPRR